MSKTFTYVLLVIAVYVAIIATKTASKKDEEKSDKKNDSSKNEKVETGASGRLKYGIGTVK